MNAICTLRETLELTQAQLAESAGTSQSAIAAYENGARSPTLGTLERIAAAAHRHVEVTYFPPLTQEDPRSLALHSAIAARLREPRTLCWLERVRRSPACGRCIPAHDRS